MPRATKPMRRRNTKRRPPDLASAQREAARERAMANVPMHGEAPMCEFEMDFGPTIDSWNGPIWVRCDNLATETAHLVRRHKCGDAVYDVNVVLASCKRCHDWYDGRRNVITGRESRASAAARLRCFEAIRHAEVRRMLSGRACAPADSQACSGCSESYEYGGGGERGSGCRECGYTGRSRTATWIPLDMTA